MRDTSRGPRGETIQLDTAEEGFTPQGESNPIFQTANASGSTVFFTDEQRLTKRSTASSGHSDLYACQIRAGSEGTLACKLTDLTDSAVVKNAGESRWASSIINNNMPCLPWPSHNISWKARR